MRSSLDIPLLPEIEQDKQIAALMRLQSAKSIGEKEDEKISEILNRPALPSSTITTFGGLKRQKLIGHRLTNNDLGIVKRKIDMVENSTDVKKCKIHDDNDVSTNLSKSNCNTTDNKDRNSSLELLMGNYGNSSDSNNSNE